MNPLSAHPPAIGPEADAAPRTGPLRHRRGGSVVVVVLVLVFFASFLLMQLVETGAVELMVEMRRADRDRLRDDAYSALETTLAVLADFRAVDRQLYAPEQGWNDPLNYAGFVPRDGVSFEIKFEDESGKLSLPRLTREQLVALFVSLGQLENDASRISDALFAWMRRDYTPEHYDVDPFVYELAELPFSPPMRSPRSFEELRAVEVVREYLFSEDGTPTQLGAAFRDSISLYDFDGSNLNAARESTMMAAGFDPAQFSTVSDYRLGTGSRAAGAPPYFRSTQEFRSVMGNAPADGLGTEIKVLRILLTAREGAATLTLNAVVCQPGEARLPGSTERSDAESDTNAPSTTSPNPPTSPAPTPGSPNQPDNPSGSLNYPFTILELSESTIAPPQPVESADS